MKIHGNAKDETGKVYGRLTVLEKVESVVHSNGKSAAFLCQCSCGNKTIKVGSRLRKGKVRSCGCYQLECQRQCGKLSQKIGSEAHRKYPIASKERRTYFYNCRAKFNLFPQAIDNLFIRANGKCEICSEQFENHKNGANIDHNHMTGRIRGILCQRCNALLAGLEDKEFCMKATLYLKERDGEVL